MEQALISINLAIFIYFISILLWYTTTLVLSLPILIKHRTIEAFAHVDTLVKTSQIPVALLIPVFNGHRHINNAIYSVLNNDYPNIELIVVNDGSTDETLEGLKKTFKLKPMPIPATGNIHAEPVKQHYQSSQFPNLWVVDKEHGPNNNGADSHNAALNITTAPIVITFDSDTIMEPNAIRQMLFYFLSHKHCLSVGGAVYVLNGNSVKNGRLLSQNIPRTLVPAIQWLEYLRSFTFGRTGLNPMNGALFYPGAFTLFETKMLRELGGFDATNFSYDAEITINIQHFSRQHHYPTHVRYCADAIAWTHVPETLKTFWNQRNRWQRGMLLSAYLHKSMLFNPRYGSVGLLTFPCYILYEILGPVVECIAYLAGLASVYFGLVTWIDLLWAILFSYGAITIFSILALFFNTLVFETRASQRWITSIGISLVEFFGFRQFRAVCCFVSTLEFVFNKIRGKRL